MARTPNVDITIDVDGLKSLRRALREAGDGMDRDLGKAGKYAADLVARTAADRVPVRSGAARDSVRAVTSYGGGAVRAGGARAPYYGWLEWGGRVGRNDSVSRARSKVGRYIYPALAARRDEVIDRYTSEVTSILKRAGLL